MTADARKGHYERPDGGWLDDVDDCVSRAPDTLLYVTADDVHALTAAARAPLAWSELVERTDSPDGAWTWDSCLVCGSPDVTTFGLVLADGPTGVLRRVAWCEHVACDVDRAHTDYLPTPLAAAVLRADHGITS